MFHIQDVLQLKDDEIVKLVIRQHPVALVPGLLLALVLIVTPFFFLFVLFDWGWPGVGAFLALVLGGILAAGRALIVWDADVLIVTTFRLVKVDQRGVFSRFVKELPLVSVADVGWHRRGILDTLFRIGALHVQGTEGVGKIEVERISHPELVHEMVSELRDSVAPKRREVTPVTALATASAPIPSHGERSDKLRVLMKILEPLEPEAYDRIESLIKRELRQAAVKEFLADNAENNADEQEKDESVPA